MVTMNKTMQEEFFLEKSGLIESISDTLLHLSIRTICLDGRWGTGKTFFCRRLVEHLELCSEAPLVLYMDCFEEDSVNEPMLSLMSLLYRKIDEDIKQEVASQVVRVLKTSVLVGATIGLNFLMPGQGKEIVDIARGSGKSKNLLDVYSDKKQALDELRDSLKKISENRKIIFVLDELDRCRPDYALKVLENVKHVFNVDGVKFLFSVNESMLKRSIAHVYGISDCQEYLDKFFEQKVTLPRGSGCKTLETEKLDNRGYSWLVSELCKKEKIIDQKTNYILTGKANTSFSDRKGVEIIVMREVLNSNERTIRDAEKIMRYVDYIYKHCDKPSYFQSKIFLTAILYTIWHQDEAYNLLVNGMGHSRVDLIARKVFPSTYARSQTKYLISSLESSCHGEIENDRTSDCFINCLRVVAGLNNN